MQKQFLFLGYKENQTSLIDFLKKKKIYNKELPKNSSFKNI